eukprot:2502158-Pleurochrysis_carterae.AAC.1
MDGVRLAVKDDTNDTHLHDFLCELVRNLRRATKTVRVCSIPVDVIICSLTKNEPNLHAYDG